jgi:arylsulfatase A-like enzyme
MRFAGRLVARRDLARPANANPETAGEPGTSPPDADEIATMKDLYDAEVRYTDDSLGELFAILDAAGILPDAVIAVVADHGESLGEHGSPTDATADGASRKWCAPSTSCLRSSRGWGSKRPTVWTAWT